MIASHGRAITALVQRVQNGLAWEPAPRLDSTRSPRVEIRAGSRVTAPSSEIKTTIIAPMAIERMAWLSIMNRPASEMITAAPEKITARPEEASASPRASSGPSPRRRSSR